MACGGWLHPLSNRFTITFRVRRAADAVRVIALRFRRVGLCEEVFNYVEELIAVLLPHDRVRAFANFHVAFPRGIHY